MLLRMCGRTIRLSCIVVLAIWLLASFVRGQEPDAAWFKANYLPAVEKLDKFYSECSATVSQTVTSDDSDDYNKATFRFGFDGPRRKFDRTIESSKNGSITSRSRTIVASPDVSFMILTRPEKGPLLEQVNRSPMGFAQATTQIDAAAFDSIYASFSLLEKRFSQYINDKDFEIKSVKRDGDRIRLDFHYKNETVQFDGWVVLLPQLQWVIDRSDISLKVIKSGYSYRIARTMSYGSDTPVPVLTGSETSTYHPNRTDQEKMVVEELTFAAVPASEFKLSAYGYDDRIGSPASVGKSLWFWLSVAGVLCLLMALGIRMRYRHAV